MRRVLAAIASVLIIMGSAAALPAVVPDPHSLEVLVPSLTAPHAFAAVAPAYDENMAGYLDLAAGLLAFAESGGADWATIVSGMAEAHTQAAGQLGGQSAVDGPDRLAALLTMRDAATQRYGSDDVPAAIDLLRGQIFTPSGRSLDRMATVTAAADALGHVPMDDAHGALLQAGAALLAMGAETDLSTERALLDSIMAAYAAADDAATPTGAALSLLALQSREASGPYVPFVADPREAALSLYQAVGVEPTHEQHAALARFADLDTATSAVLAQALYAHRLQHEGTAAGLHATPPDFPAMLAARHAAVKILAEIDFPAASCVTGVADNTSAVFSYDLSCADSWYDVDSRFVFDLAGDDTYRNNAGGTGPVGAGFEAAMLIDMDGGDRYRALYPQNGGYIGSGHGGSGILLDLAGDDSYEAHAGFSTVAAIGSAYSTAGATGLLIDAGGNDTYDATSGVDLAANGGATGAAENAAGALIDLGGADTYRVTHAGAYANIAANGAGLGTFGVPNEGDPEREAYGLLADLGGGDDVYDVRGSYLRTSANGGGFDSARGLLLDGGGNDTYTAWSRFFGALNGGGIGGRTFANAAGYPVTTPSLGAGALVDLGPGDDHYTATIDQGEGAVGGVNGAGAIRGSGLLVDAGGDDRYVALFVPGNWAEGNIQGAANGAAADGGTGVLVDLGGSDLYDALLVAGPDGYAWGAANGAACGLSEIVVAMSSDCVWSGAPTPTAAALLDLGAGADTYRANITGGFAGRDSEVAYGSANGGASDAHALLFDGGGDDTYWARIGDERFNQTTQVYPRGYGAIGGAAYKRGAAALVDLGGNDTHDARVLDGAVNGAASHVLFDVFTTDNGEQASSATGVLFDRAGNDVYKGLLGWGAANGGGQGGAGALIDASGDDTYDAEVLASGGMNGGAGPHGAGLLLDGSGNDAYHARGHAFAGMNGGASGFSISGGEQLGTQPFGVAGLFDGAGSDSYQALLRPEHPLGTGFDFVMAAAHGAGALGSGVLVDGGGDDVYDCRIEGYGALNGSGFVGQGTLIDAAGTDRYNASLDAPGGGAVGAVNGAAVQGLGLLVDGAGDDEYVGLIAPDFGPFTGPAFGAANGAALVGGGMILDGHGSNLFTAALGGNGVTNGAAGGFLPDLPGTWLDNITHLFNFLAQGAPQAVGLLVGGTGDDVYESSGVTQGAADAYGLGMLIDPAGDDNFTAGPVALAQGAARHGGTGMLVDLGGNATFRLLADSSGQGYAEQGAGVLVQADPMGHAQALVDVTATVGRTSGAGIGMRLVLGIGDLVVEPPTCSESYEILDINDTSEERVFKVCGPDEASSVYIIDPRTGQPMEDQDKPPVPCGDETVPLGEECGDTVEAVLGPDADDWLRSDTLSMRTSGGLALTMVGAANPADRILYGEYYVNMIDDSCSYGCWTMEELFFED